MRRNRTSDYSHPTLTCLVRIKARTKAPRRFSEDEWTSLLKSSLRRTRFSYSDQPIGIDLGRIELDLNLYILGDRYKRSAHLFDQHFTRFVQRIDIGVVAVSSVRKFFRASNPSNFRYRSPARSERHGFFAFSSIRRIKSSLSRAPILAPSSFCSKAFTTAVRRT